MKREHVADASPAQAGTIKWEEIAGSESSEGVGQDLSVEKSSEQQCIEDGGGQVSLLTSAPKVVRGIAFVIMSLSERIHNSMD